MITGKNSFTSLWRDFGPLFFPELFKFSHTGGFSSINGPFNVMPKHLNLISVYTLTRSSQNLIFDLFEPFRGGLFCFASLSCCIIQMQLSFRTQMDGQAFFFRIFYLRAEFLIIPSVTASCPSPERAMHLQNITQPPSCSIAGMMFFFFTDKGVIASSNRAR